jgi:hypothetical protein
LLAVAGGGDVPRPIEEKLHTGLGLRRPKLARLLTEPSLPDRVTFAERLHIFVEADRPEVILAKAIWQLAAVINRIPCDQKWITVLRAMYNLDQDPELNPLVLKERLELLHRRHGKGWDPSTTNSKLSELRSTHIYPRLKSRKFDWPPDDEITALAESERRYAKLGESGLGTFVLPKDTLGVMIADLRGSGRSALKHVLPQVDLHFAVSAKGNLVTTATTEFGENLPVFTSNALLRQYQDKVRAPVTDKPMVANGRIVVDLLVAWRHVGLAVNPLGDDRTDVGQYWTPEDLVGL